MTTQEAYDFTIDKVNELQKSGIKVETRSCNSKDNPETIAKYSSPENVAPEFWVHISFKTDNKPHLDQIHEAVNYLGMCGISFDTGGCCGQRDWELDWSFRYKEGDEDWEKRDTRDDVEDVLRSDAFCNKLKK